MGKELLLGLGLGSFGTSFTHHVLVLPFEEAKLWRQRQRSKDHRSQGSGKGHADQEGRQRDQEAQRIMWQSVK